jgi:hypothetical protein
VTPAPPPRVVRFERTVALALASAAASAPSVVGVALAALAVLPGNAIWAVACGFAAGAVALQGRRSARLLVVLLLVAGLAVPLVHLGSSVRPYVLTPDDAAASVARVLVGATALTACVVALSQRHRVFVALGAALMADLCAVAIAGLVVGWTIERTRWTELALAALTLVVAELARRRRDLAAVVLLGVAMAVCVASRHWLLGSSDVLGTAVAVMLLPLAYLAGAFAADLEEGVAPDGGTRLVVLAQRRPWATSVAIAAAIVGATCPWAVERLRHANANTVTTCLLLVPAAFAFLAHAGRGGRATIDRLAPWLAANVAVAGSAFAYAALTPWGIHWTSALMVLVPFAVWPLVCAALLPGEPPAGETPAALICYPATLVLFPPILAAVFRSADLWAVGTAACLAIVPLALHATVRSRRTTPQILAAAVLLGAASAAIRPAGPAEEAVRADGNHVERLAMSAALPPIVWLLGALMAVAARRCRSMTAVPRDHPIVEDFRVE